MTSGVHTIGPVQDGVAVAQSPVWGLGRGLRLEHPELWGGLIDLDPELAAEEGARRLVEELLGSDGEDQLALRGGERHVARLVRSQRGRGAPLKLRADATYLLTGGLGGLGLEVCRWMVGRGVRHLALMSREASAPARERLRELEAAGAQIAVFQGDVSREGDVRRILAEMGRTMPPLRGVIHLAGIGDDCALVDMDWPRFAKVLAPKVAGGWNLHALTLQEPLDFFVLFSSQAGLMGSTSQGSYSAANTFLDALAHHRRALGLPGLSIVWGPWTDVGIAPAGCSAS